MSPSVGSAVCTSTGEVGRGAIKVMGPSAVFCKSGATALQTKKSGGPDPGPPVPTPMRRG